MKSFLQVSPRRQSYAGMALVIVRESQQLLQCPALIHPILSLALAETVGQGAGISQFEPFHRGARLADVHAVDLDRVGAWFRKPNTSCKCSPGVWPMISLGSRAQWFRKSRAFMLAIFEDEIFAAMHLFRQRMDESARPGRA